MDVNAIRAVAMSLAICTNRPWNLGNIVAITKVTTDVDGVLVVVDIPDVEIPPGYVEALRDAGVQVLLNGLNRGLSFSRNRALAECPHRMLVFLDDDVTITEESLEQIRAAATAGSGIIGVLLVPSFPSDTTPWWFTGGQYHYLGVHHRADRAKTWGACMAIDPVAARENGISFRDELGRRGRQLQSGDDTTFLSQMRAAGLRETFLLSATASHHVPAVRLRFGYLLRRAWWQGRSERRRQSLGPSVLKEWHRNTAAGPHAARLPRRLALAGVYVAAVIVGGIWEALLPGTPHGRGR